MAAPATESPGIRPKSLVPAFARLVMTAVASLARADDGIRRETVSFARGASSAQIKGSLKGRETIDYVIRAAAGQTLRVALQGKSNPQNYFNVLLPGSKDAAMFVGDARGDVYQGLLPSDGDYVLRVYLMRAAGRRDEASTFTLSVGVTGKALRPTPSAKDALVPGTPYHASGTIQCRPAFEPALRDCEAFALRRSAGGTAMIDVPSKTGKRSILFVDGTPVASNGLPSDTLGSERRGDVTIVKLGADQRYEIPDALVSGG
jgi:hypothetical protein